MMLFLHETAFYSKKEGARSHVKSTKESIFAIIFGPISRVPKRRGFLADRQAIGHPCSPVWSACLEWKNKEEKQDGGLHHHRRRRRKQNGGMHHKKAKEETR
jgi:hypothetical protein